MTVFDAAGSNGREGYILNDGLHLGVEFFNVDAHDCGL